MKLSFDYACSECGQSFEIKVGLMLCPDCSARKKQEEPLRGVLEVRFQGEVRDNFGPLDLLPVEREYFPDLPVGNTPLWSSGRLCEANRFPGLYIKDDGLNPTGSLKDRASMLVAAFARKHGIGEVVVASTGNAGSSMSGVGAAAGLQVKLFLPKTAPPAKMVQSLQYGAEVILAEKNYDQAFSLSLEYSDLYGGLNRNTAFNPLTIEGKKTVSIEIWQQLRKCPDRVYVSVGDGVILSGVYKGFRDLHQLGLISRVPVIVGVQAEGSDAITRALKTGKFEAKPSLTVADSISVDIPSNGYLALKNLKNYRGCCVTVSDETILEAQKELSSIAGVFAEPASAAAYAGFLKEKIGLDPETVCVILLTGNGLKDVNAASRKLKIPEHTVNSLDELKLST